MSTVSATLVLISCRYDEVKGYIEFNALSEMRNYYNNFGEEADYEVAFWKVTNNDGTAILQDDEGNQIINIGTSKFKIIDAKRGIFAVGTTISGREDINDEEDNATFEGDFNLYSIEGTLVVSNVVKYNRLDFSNIALIQTSSGAYFLFDTNALSVTRNLNYDKVEVLDYEYVKVTNYGRYSWEDKVGLLNSKCEFIVPAKYQDLRVLSYGISATDKNWNDILFDFDGNALNSPEENAQLIKDGYYMVTDKGLGKITCEVSGIPCIINDGEKSEDEMYDTVKKALGIGG